MEKTPTPTVAQIAPELLCRERVIARAALQALPRLVAEHGLGVTLLAVGDPMTFAACPLPSMPGAITIHNYSLGITPQATVGRVEAVMEQAQSVRATGLLAVGAGSVNDIVKLAATRLEIPYVCVATAASMNGYTSATASIKTAGIKSSYAAVPPRAVLADIDVIAIAPLRLLRSGLGDTLCRSTVEADCLLSHHLLGTPYPAEGFQQLRAHETTLLSGVENFQENMHSYSKLLMCALIDTGDWMARTGSSAIASQGEHMIAHTIEMLYDDVHKALHGETIAVTTITMQQLQRKTLLGNAQVRPVLRTQAQFNDIFGVSKGRELYAMWQKKSLDEEDIAQLNLRLDSDWPAIKSSILAIMAKESLVERTFTKLGIPFAPASIGLTEERYQSALSYAYLTRDRFTFLDLAMMMGRRL